MVLALYIVFLCLGIAGQTWALGVAIGMSLAMLMRSDWRRV